MSAGGRAAALGMSHILLEKADHASDTIYKYQKGKLVMATPDQLPLRSDFEFELGIREDILGSWDDSLESLGVNIRYKAEVTAISGEKGNFTLTINGDETITAEYIVFAIGLQGNLRKMGVPGQEWDRVQYQLDDPDEYEDENIVVIGAGDAAIENAVALSKQNNVSIVNRRDEFARAKDGNVSLILSAIDKGDVKGFYNASPTKVEPGTLTLKTEFGEEDVPVDRVIARLGAIPPRKFVEDCGIEFPNDNPASLPEVSPQYESNVSGLYIIGALGGFPLIRQAMNQGYEVIEFINGNFIKPADEPLIEEKLTGLPGVSVDDFLAQLREKVPLYAEVNTIMLREMMLDSNVHVMGEGDVVFERGETTNSFYVIVDGGARIEVDPNNPNLLIDVGQGNFFGEMGLISGRARTATIYAKEGTVLLETNRRTMIKLINSVDEVKQVMDRVAMTRQIQTYMANSVSNEGLAPIVEKSKVETLRKGQALFEEGDDPGDVFLLRRGSVTITRKTASGDVVLSYVPTGSYVGEAALINDMPYYGSARAAVDNTEVLRLDGQEFVALMNANAEFGKDMRGRDQDRESHNVRMMADPRKGRIVDFLVNEGIGEATNILLIDETLCVRCDNCEKACAETHGGIPRMNREAGPTFGNIHVPISCRHCEHPHCMKDCPPDAIHRTATGEVYIKTKGEGACIGCGNCERNCPYDVITMRPPEAPQKPGLLQWLLFGQGPGPGADMSVGIKSESKKATKCDQCMDVDGGPSCVRACPTGAAIRVSPEEFFAASGAAWSE